MSKRPTIEEIADRHGGLDLAEHTSTPWEWDSDGHIYPEDNEGLLQVDGYLPSICRARYNREANARRIVECVNALEGMDPGALPAVLSAARLVVDRWEKGDLAEAVRALDGALP